MEKKKTKSKKKTVDSITVGEIFSVSIKTEDAVAVFRGAVRVFVASPILLIAILLFAVLPLAAFEAHVINITAIIEMPPMCSSLSIGYWTNHEGCSKGQGTSDWTNQINSLSDGTLRGAFGDISDTEICEALWIPNCDPGNTLTGRLCRARAHALGDELNIVSNKLQLDALLALADDGDPAFDNLFLSQDSTVEEALYEIESIINDQDSTLEQLRDAAYVAMRIYTYYEEENPQAPFCIYDPENIPQEILYSPSKYPYPQVGGIAESTTVVCEGDGCDSGATSTYDGTSTSTAEVLGEETTTTTTSTTTTETSTSTPAEDPPTEDPPTEDPLPEDPPTEEDPPPEPAPEEQDPPEDTSPPPPDGEQNSE